ncbi:MAG: hypothetical protein ACYTBJ_17405, partial [Planctomycetota bacterium]
MATDPSWSTGLPGTQDAVGVQQPDLTDDTVPGALDGDRVNKSLFHALRDKLQYVSNTVGDASELP